ncbi:MAG: U32 family peptidase [Proteobacteria bacterium]|nr:U32 family peptidase [Pseudomonadota bacterium]
MQRSVKNIQEILAPVGDWEMCQAAVHNGADAIYVGVPRFNARGRTADLEMGDLEEMISFCHLYGVKVYLAFNILIFQNELKEVVQLLPELLSLNPDAFIVQDLGLSSLIKKMSPGTALHASTQMAVNSHEGIDLLQDLDIKRFVLGREVSLREISIIRKNTRKELEVFVHGALCVAYSGQCLTSESMGGRSANRGQCAQSCRLPYELIVDGKKKDLGNQHYLLSPKDLFGLPAMAQLKDLEIDAFKIEGRLKSPEYVATAVSAYKKGLSESIKTSDRQVVKGELELAFSRGFSSGWLEGVQHQQLVDGRFSGHRGLLIGKVLNLLDNRRFPTLIVEVQRDLSKGDSLLFCDRNGNSGGGGKIYQLTELKSNRYQLGFSTTFDPSKIGIGDDVFLNRSARNDKGWQKSWKEKQSWKKIPLQVVITGASGQPLSISVSDQDNHHVRGESEFSLELAKKRALSRVDLEPLIAAMGNRPFILENLKLDLPEDLFLHHKEIKKLKNNLLDRLQWERSNKNTIPLFSQSKIIEFIDKKNDSSSDHLPLPKKVPELNILIRNINQIKELSNLGISTVYLDLGHGSEYKKAVTDLKNQGFKAGIATTRILKPKEYKHLRVILSARPDRILVRNLGALHYLTERKTETPEIDLFGDFSLNITNSLSAGYLLSKGLEGICPAYDLNNHQLFNLIDKVSPSQFEITIHQQIPSYHMEHCVFAALLSQGNSSKDCGMPCENHSVELRDEQNIHHPVKADQECRNTVFNGQTQSAANLVPDLLERGVRKFRVESLLETPQQLRSKIQKYLELIEGKSTPQELFSSLNIEERYGISDGQLLLSDNYRNKKKKFIKSKIRE